MGGEFHGGILSLTQKIAQIYFIIAKKTGFGKGVLLSSVQFCRFFCAFGKKIPQNPETWDSAGRIDQAYSLRWSLRKAKMRKTIWVSTASDQEMG